MAQPYRSLGILSLLVSLAVGASVSHADQATSKPPTDTERRHGLPVVSELKAIKYRSIGPSQGGRISRVAGVPGDPNTYYAATASGGVWKSADGGATWKAIFDQQPISSIGSIAVAPSDPNVVYVGSGEANIRGNVAAGNGIYKSTDAGKTWVHVWRQEGQIGTMVVHPRNPDVAYAAVLGRAFGPNPERGVYRTRDGGRTWQQVLKRDADTGASDVALDPSNPSVVFAGLWQARRRPWELVSGGPGGGLHVSRDGGDTWKQVTGSGLPAEPWGKVGVAVAPSDGRRVYALIEAEQGGLFRSDDGGDTWTLASGNRLLRQRAWYYTTIVVHPANANEAWFPQVPMLKTIDGGRTVKIVEGFRHGDHHDLWIDPRNPNRMIDGNDGGVEMSVDGGETWWPALLPIGQFYHVSADTRHPFHVAGAQQDLGTAQGPSNSLVATGIGPGDWRDVGGGEAGHVVSKPDDPDIVYAGEYLGYISRYDDRTRQAKNISIYPENGSGHGAADLKYRFQWTAPIATSPHDPDVVYHAGNVLFRTRDGGQTWTAISGDLTRNDRSKQQWSGGPITGDNTGVEFYGTIFAVAESPRQAGVIWAGSDDGLVHVTRDGGATWKNVTGSMAGFPEWATISLIEPSPFDAAAAYVVVDAHRLDDARPYLYRTTDFGASWTRLDAGLPSDVYLHAVREDPRKRGYLYLGTERGVAFSTDAGTTWRSLQLNLPTVAVHDLVVKDDALVVGTHGRSIWILDDLPVVRELGDIGSKAVHLFAQPGATRWRYASGGTRRGAGENPPAGARLYYYLREKPKGPLTIEILDDRHRLVRTLTSVVEPDDGTSDQEQSEEARRKRALPADAGVQRAVWDLHWEGAPKIPRAKIDWGSPARGPMARPGAYTVRLSVGGHSLTAPLRVLPDPRVRIAEADLLAQEDLALRVRDDLIRLHGLVGQLRRIRGQLQDRRPLLVAIKGGGALVTRADEIAARCDALEARLHNPAAQVTYDILAQKGGAQLYSRLSPLLDFLVSADGAPTQGVREVHAEQSRELAALAAEVERLMTTDVVQLDDLATQAGVGFVLR